MLAARRLADFSGPLGWAASSVNLGRTDTLKAGPVKGVEARLRKTQPLVELRIPFELSRNELEAVGRGSEDHDLAPLVQAARTAAMAEDRVVFHGYREAGITGIMDAAAPCKHAITDGYAAYLGIVAEATDKLRNTGVDGPYAIALGPRCFTGLAKTTIGGFPVIEHVRRLLDGPIVSAPAIEGAVVLSLRGGDFELTVGQDFSIGYLDHTATTVQLYLQEHFTFRALSPEAAIPLEYTET